MKKGGADDYIVKPFFIREVIARIKLQFRTQAAPSRLLKAGGVELDRSSCQVKMHGETLSLTATEFRLLEFLMSRPGVVFSREQLLNAVWGQDRAITDRAVDVYVLRLRQKVERDPASPILRCKSCMWRWPCPTFRIMAAVMDELQPQIPS